MEFRDLKAQYGLYKKDIDNAIQKVLDNADFIGGKAVHTLEEKLAEYVGVRHCITCANGTDAMTLVLTAWNIKEGDAVFVPDFTFFATGEVAALRSATPVFVDVDWDTFNMDTQKLEKAIQRVLMEGKLTPRVIIPVDLFGLPADHFEIRRIAQKYGLLVLEDGAQGFGGSINGTKACSFGDAATTSFFPAKPLGCYGDGGAIFTNDDELAGLLNSYKVHGKGMDKYDNVRIGINSRLDTIQAAVLEVKLDAFVRHELDDANNVYHSYNKRLTGIVETPVIPEGFISSFAQYTIKLGSKEQRDGLQSKLREQEIPGIIYYKKPLHKQTAFSGLEYGEKDVETADKLCDIVLSLPMHPYMKGYDIDRVAKVIENHVIS